MKSAAICVLAAVLAASGWGCVTHKPGTTHRSRDGVEQFATDKSHLIGKVKYDRKTQEMRVQMSNSSDWYVYRDVPPGLYEAFVKSASKGAFFVQEIKGRFPGRREE